MENDDIYQRLLGFALNYVSIRPRSTKEISEYIVKKIHHWNISPSYLPQVMNRLRELEYVDDLKFACSFIASMNRSRPKGVMLIRMELKKKGIDTGTIEKAQELIKAEGSDDDTDLARIAATKKLRSLQRYDKTGQRVKLYSFLARRGFDHAIISSIIDEMFTKGLQ